MRRFLMRIFDHRGRRRHPCVSCIVRDAGRLEYEYSRIEVSMKRQSGFGAEVGHRKLRVLRFVRWYNEDHQHSGIQFVTPQQRHTGEAQDIVKRRQQIYQNARAQHPERWSQNIRNWDLPTEVWLNPERASPESKQEAA